MKKNAGALRLTVLLTHPVQYYAPWFRYIHARCPDIALSVLYASRPDAAQQATGYATAFEWDVPLLDGYDAVFARENNGGARFGTDDYRGIDIADIGDALGATKPDVVLIPGWHSITYVRALRWCRNHRIPTIWRGDTHGIARSSPLWYIRTRYLLHRFDFHLAVGLNTSDYLRRFGVRETGIYASPHHVDNDHFRLGDSARAAARSETRASLGIGAHTFVIAVAGRIAPHKNQRDVIDAAAALGGNAAVLLIGDGPDRDDCTQHAANVGVTMVCTGFVNQSALPATYAAADVVVVAGNESWGLVINEALAGGVPVIANDHAGATRDLVVPRVTGERYRKGDVADLKRALNEVREGLRRGDYGAAGLHAHVATYSMAAATTGLAAACDAAVLTTKPRILTIAGGLFAPTGMERMTFEILRSMRREHARLHCSVNNWAPALWPDGPHLIIRMAQANGSSWSFARYRTRLNRSLNPLRQIAVIGDVISTSTAVLGDAWRLRPTHVFCPEYTSALRILPALLVLRLAGVPVILKLPTAVPEGAFYRRVWRWLIDRAVSTYVPQSEFTEKSLLVHGIRTDKVVRISNVVPTRASQEARDVPHARDAPAVVRPALTGDAPLKVLYVGQIAPAKGVHLLLEAAALCVRDGLQVEVLVVGDMNGWGLPNVLTFRDMLRERASRPDLSGRVHFLGFRDDVAVVMQGAHMLCCPSMPELREAFGIVVIEAMDAGIPCVVFPTGALPEHIEHGVDGWVCRDTTAEAIAEGIAEVGKRLRAGIPMGAAAHAAVARLYSHEALREGWMRLFSVASAAASEQTND